MIVLAPLGDPAARVPHDADVLRVEPLQDAHRRGDGRRRPCASRSGAHVGPGEARHLGRTVATAAPARGALAAELAGADAAPRARRRLPPACGFDGLEPGLDPRRGQSIAARRATPRPSVAALRERGARSISSSAVMLDRLHREGRARLVAWSPGMLPDAASAPRLATSSALSGLIVGHADEHPNFIFADLRCGANAARRPRRHRRRRATRGSTEQSRAAARQRRCRRNHAYSPSA